jgi:wyosine [tRNA(Phe)-imidazoG37] synthetase (radical SAM superfamily)
MINKSKKENENGLASAWRRHERRWEDTRYVYAVISRRSRGVSIGINLNPDHACNFDCIYCQVNRSKAGAFPKVELKRLEKELARILQAESDGILYENSPFDLLSETERGVRDIAFSGNGEPTAYAGFLEAVRIAARAREHFRLNSAKLVLLTNAAYLNRSDVREALALMDDNNGEIWAKLDAGTEKYFRSVNRAHVALDRILRNILDAAKVRPLIIQTLLLRIHGAVPPLSEVKAYCERLNGILSAGGMLKAIQLYTIARDPAEAYASSLSNEELDRTAALIRERVSIPINVFYGR